MPNNTIALGVRTPQVQQSGGAAINPFSAGLDIMRMQQLANENLKTKLDLNARNIMGDVMARHPGDPEGGINEILSIPQAAPYAGDFIKTLRDADLAFVNAARGRAEIGKINLEAGDTALHILSKNMVPLYQAIQRGASEDELQAIRAGAIQQTMAVTSGMTKQQQQTAIDGINAWYTSIYANLPPEGSPQRQEAILQRLRNNFATSGLAPEAQTLITGQIPPRLAGPNEFPVGTQTYQSQNVPPGGPTPPGAPTPLVPPSWQQPPPATQPSAAQPPGQPTTQPPAGQQAGLPPARIAASDGTPLWNEKTNMVSPQAGQGRYDPTGTWQWRDPGRAKQVEGALAAYDEAGVKDIPAANNAKFQLQQMDTALDRLATTPLRSGTANQARLEIANGWNTALGILHDAGVMADDTYKKARFDPQAVAEDESFMKNMRLLQFSTVTQNFGAQREAAQVIMAALQAVPGADNSYLGSKLIIEGLRASAERVLEYRDFQNQWLSDPRNHGDLTGSREEFNRIHKPEDAAKAITAKFGMDEKGFTSEEAITTARQHGWIDKDQAAEAYKRLQARTQ